MRYLLALEASNRAPRATGTDKRQWNLIDWQIVYGDCEPAERMTHENYIPHGAAPARWLEQEYGPWAHAGMKGRVVYQFRKDSDA